MRLRTRADGRCARRAYNRDQERGGDRIMATHSVAVVGGGIMGGDIATSFASAGWDVHVMSPSARTRDALPVRVAKGLERLGADAARGAAVHVRARLSELPWQSI